MRLASGKILLRISRRTHRALAREAFQKGRSINQLCLEAILARNALKNYDAWKSIESIWEKNKKVDSDKLTSDIRHAISEVRRAR